eukprot:TRINITY_DN19877_c0_g3_i1.p1 TRINITY_DN19877_c0_g3~~TRINITY_DN19877_c0_g3_i1.p1  ORF type:complete len:545 (+),score=100.19 TRINITY_DN19877_c0_g3_i1:61-1695(+)
MDGSQNAAPSMPLVASPSQQGFPPQAYDLCLMLFVVESVIGMVWYHKRRKYFPIAQRQPFLVMIETCLTIFSAFFSSLQSTEHLKAIFFWTSCGANLILLTLTYNFLVMLAGTRILLVLYWNFLTSISIKLRKIEDEAATTAKLTRFQFVILKVKKYLTVEFFILQALFISLLGSLVSTNFLLSDEIMFTSLFDPKCLDFEKTVLVNNAFFTLMIIALNSVLFVWMYFSVHERLLLKAELTGIIVTGTWLIIFLTIQWFPSLSDPLREINLLRFLYSIISGQLYIVLIVFRVIAWSYQAEATRKSVISEHQAYLTLNSEEKTHFSSPGKYEILEEVRKCFEDPCGRELFVQFLTQEFAVENALFLIECQEFRKEFQSKVGVSRQVLFESALRIYRRFVPLHAQFCINLSSQNTDFLISVFSKFDHESPNRKSTSVSFIKSFTEKHATLLEEVEELPFGEASANECPSIDVSVFDDAVKEISKLLARDSFLRFKSTPEYKKFIAELTMSKPSVSRSTMGFAISNIGKTLTRMFTANVEVKLEELR